MAPQKGPTQKTEAQLKCTTQEGRNANWLTPQEIKDLEAKYADGIRVGDIAKIFKDRGFRFSVDTFRKYVQMGLLLRAIRTGTPGKHRGSHGLYPVKNIRRVHDLKVATLQENTTLEQAKVTLLQRWKRQDAFTNALEVLVLTPNTQHLNSTALEKGLARHLRAALKELDPTWTEAQDDPDPAN